MDLSPPRTRPSPCLETLLRVIEETFPLPGRFRARLPSDIAELSRLLTCARPERDGAYLGRPNLLSAYLRYFLPWNVFRLCRLFEGLGRENGCFCLEDGDALTDLGSGPFTLPLAMRIAFPSLKNRKLEFRCVDRSAPALEAGLKLFRAFAPDTRWKTAIIRDSLDAPIRGGKAKIVSALNVYNEVYGGRRETAKHAALAAGVLSGLCSPGGSIFVMEPGVPQAAFFISALRAALFEKGRITAAPCTHSGICPLPGTGNTRKGKAKWCHFAFGTENAPRALRALSAAAGIPKERAVFSYLLTGPVKAGSAETLRVISGMFPLSQNPPARADFGRYGCCGRGLVLLRGSKSELENCPSGSVVEYIPARAGRDGKSGALIAGLRHQGPQSPGQSAGLPGGARP